MRVVYGLMHPITKEVFYIGETKNLKKRIYQHFSRSVTDNKSKCEIVRDIIDNLKLKPDVIVFQENIQTKEESEAYESNMIKLHKSLGYRLTNMNEGGNKPPSQKGVKLNHGRRILETSKRKKTVYQYSKDMQYVGEFISVREAGRQTGIDHRSIAEVANGSNPKRHKAGGYYWKYNKVENDTIIY